MTTPHPQQKKQTKNPPQQLQTSLLTSGQATINSNKQLESRANGAAETRKKQIVSQKQTHGQ